MPRLSFTGRLMCGDPSMFWSPVQSMHRSIAESGSVRTRLFVVQILSGFSVLALALAAVGLYGVMAYLVIERRREIAVRMALGATHSVLFGQILGEAGRLLLVGLFAGAIAARWLTRWIASLLFGVTTTDLATHLVVFLVLGTVGLLASYLPARRSSDVYGLARFAFHACSFMRLRSRLNPIASCGDVPPKRRSREGGQPLGHLSALESTVYRRTKPLSPGIVSARQI